MPTPQQLPNDDLIRATVTEILNRPEFGASSDLPWYAELLRRLRDWAGQFGDWAVVHPVLGWVVLGLLVLVLIGLLAHLAYLVLGDLLPWSRNRAVRHSSASSWTILEGAASSWEEALAKARQALGEGNHRLVVWISHRVLLGLLDEQGTLRFAAGKTNTHYLHECARDHPWRDTLATLTEAYDRVIYGQQPAAAAHVETLLGQVETCRAQAAHDL